MRRLVLLVVLISLTLASANTALTATPIDRVIAVVGPDVVTLSELQTEMAPALAEINQRLSGDDLAKATDRLRRATLAGLVDRYLQLQEARLQGIEVATEEVDAAIEDIMKKNNLDKAAFAAALANEGYTVEDYRKSISDQLTILRLVNRAVKPKIEITEDEIKDYYAKNAARFTEPESVRVANITFPAPDGDIGAALKNAESARAEILGGTPFEEMAAKCSGNADAAKTCVLGSFGRGELSPVIEEKAFSMTAGEVSEPIPTNGGYQLIKVMERTGSGTKTLDEVRGMVVEELSSQKGETIFAKWIQELRKRAHVEIRE